MARSCVAQADGKNRDPLLPPHLPPLLKDLLHRPAVAQLLQGRNLQQAPKGTPR
jgi:hypothetical protein